MANHLDLEEQEQIDQLKHFWNTWGTLISSVLVVVFGSVTAWNGYQFWQNRQALQAAALFDAVESATQVGDQAHIDQIFSDIRSKYAGTIQADQAGLMVAKVQIEKGDMDAANNVLEWVVGNASDEGYRAVAHLRLASLLMEKKSYENALIHLSNKFPVAFEAIAADRKGDLLAHQGKKQEATAEYIRAYKMLNEGAEYRRLIEVKLNALGVQPQVVIISGAVGVTK